MRSFANSSFNQSTIIPADDARFGILMAPNRISRRYGYYGGI
jgi:hypothetical protein